MLTRGRRSDSIEKAVEWKRSAAILQKSRTSFGTNRVEELGNDNVPGNYLTHWRQSITGLKIVGFARGRCFIFLQ